jgi:hypothetical protein
MSYKFVDFESRFENNLQDFEKKYNSKYKYWRLWHYYRDFTVGFKDIIEYKYSG